jgi:hypothetical protein
VIKVALAALVQQVRKELLEQRAILVQPAQMAQ